MSLWQEFQRSNSTSTLVEEVTDSMFPVLYEWVSTAASSAGRQYQLATIIKNIFKISIPIPMKRPHNSIEAPDDYKLTQFLINIAVTDSKLFFTVVDYLIQTHGAFTRRATSLEIILNDAGHKYKVLKIDDKYTIMERLPSEQERLMDGILGGQEVYASEFRDAFTKLYGTSSNPTEATSESFQSLESALKFHLGDDKGKNLGAILDWLKNNRDKWTYALPSSGQSDADEAFIANIDFVNKSFRKVKHGQATEKLTVAREHAETNIRTVALIIYELESTIILTEQAKLR